MERDNAKNRRVRKKAKRVNRSTGGNVLVFLMLVILGGFMLLPVLYTVVQAFKPMEELFLFPPRFTVSNPTVKNFKLIGQLIDSLWVPFSRYTFNSVFVSTAGTAGNVIIASMAAYPLAKNDFPGKKVLFRIVTVALLFSGGVLGLAQYIIMAKLHMINTYWALILPSVATPMGLFLMKQFMEGISTSLLEAARIDGMNEFQIYWNIVTGPDPVRRNRPRRRGGRGEPVDVHTTGTDVSDHPEQHHGDHGACRHQGVRRGYWWDTI